MTPGFQCCTGFGSRAQVIARPCEAPAPLAAAPERRRRFDLIYIAFGNPKLLIGAGSVFAMLVLAVIGPLLTDQSPLAFGGDIQVHPSSAD